MQTRRGERAFSLVELLVCLIVVMILASLAIPNLLKSKLFANETSSVASLRAIYSAETLYSATYPNVGFTSLSQLGGASSSCAGATFASSASACLLDNGLAVTGVKSGYNFTAGTSGASPYSQFTAVALPTTQGKTGNRAFCVDETGVIRFNQSGTACTNASPAL